MNALWRRLFDINENETNCVNYKYCLVDAPGVSNSCIDWGSQLQTNYTETIGEKVPENGPFRDQFWRGVGHLAPLRGESQNETIHR